MRCPDCGGKTAVVDSCSSQQARGGLEDVGRDVGLQRYRARRRECIACGRAEFTVEAAAADLERLAAFPWPVDRVQELADSVREAAKELARVLGLDRR